MNNEFETTPLNILIGEMTRLEQEINLALIKYEAMREEVCNRFPFLEEEEEFKPKTLVRKSEYYERKK